MELKLKCPYCGGEFQISLDERRLVQKITADAKKEDGENKEPNIQIQGWKEVEPISPPYAPDSPEDYEQEITVTATVNGRSKSFNCWKREQPFNGYMLTIGGNTELGKLKKKDFKIDEKGLYSINKGDPKSGKKWGWLSLSELKRRKPENSNLYIEQQLDGRYFIRLSTHDPTLIKEVQAPNSVSGHLKEWQEYFKGSKLNASLIEEMIEVWAMCWEPEILS